MPTSCGQRCLGSNGLAQRIGQRRVHFDRRPLPVDVIVGALGKRQLPGAEHLVGDFLNNLPGHRPQNRRRFRRPGKSRASRIPANASNLRPRFETPGTARRPCSNPPTTQRFKNSSGAMRRYRSMSSALEWVTNGRAAAPPASFCSIGVSTSRKPRRCKRVTQRAHHRDALAGHRPRLRPHDQVDVALPYPRLLVHLLVRHRQRTQRLGRHLPRIGQHG